MLIPSEFEKKGDPSSRVIEFRITKDLIDSQESQPPIIVRRERRICSFLLSVSDSRVRGTRQGFKAVRNSLELLSVRRPWETSHTLTEPSLL